MAAKPSSIFAIYSNGSNKSEVELGDEGVVDIFRQPDLVDGMVEVWISIYDPHHR
ncbi:hypothetical protein [Methylomonas koyamae]|uniref:hypothetical protein n=1 Tax=Methylomonas koyamae TaxID=702114 RepID=UPI00155D9A17|nr:hypothetical protein [Methylomonas koyamae]